MRDFKPGQGRIEPRIGADPLLESESNSARRRTTSLDSFSRGASGEKVEPRKSERFREEIATSSDSNVKRDVLMDFPAPRYAAGDVPLPRASAATRRERSYTKASPQGRRNIDATNQAGFGWKFNFHLTWFNRRVAAGVGILALGAGIYWAAGPIAKAFERPIKSVVVEGEFQLISKQHATELISNEINGDFLQLDLMELKEALLSDPWVERVTLNRRWPDTLVVKIIEQKPIARWGDGFLNQRGEIVRVPDAAPLSGLPWLQGNENDAIEILQQYQDLSQILRARGLDVIALKCDNKKSWRLTVKNHVEIAIGRDQVMEKIRRFVTVYDAHLSSVWSDVKAIDVRYTNGIAVRWVADSAMAKKYIKSPLQVGVPAPANSANSQIQ